MPAIRVTRSPPPTPRPRRRYGPKVRMYGGCYTNPVDGVRNPRRNPAENESSRDCVYIVILKRLKYVIE